MTELKQLNERIEQLTELVKSGSEAIKVMKTALEAAEKERGRLVDQRRKQEPKFERVSFDHEYYTLGFDFNPVASKEIGYDVDTWRYENNNYFHTKERAEEVAEKIRLLLRLERLHDIYCTNCESGRYYISQNTESGRYCYGYIRNVPNKFPTSAMFPSEEIAQKVCNILNAELEGKK